MLCNYSKSKIDGSESLEVLAGCKNLIQTTISVEKSDVLPEETMWVELLYLELPQAVVAQIVEASRYPT